MRIVTQTMSCCVAHTMCYCVAHTMCYCVSMRVNRLYCKTRRMMNQVVLITPNLGKYYGCSLMLDKAISNGSTVTLKEPL